MRTRADQIKFSELTRVQIPAVLHLIRRAILICLVKAKKLLKGILKRIFWYLFLEDSTLS